MTRMDADERCQIAAQTEFRQSPVASPLRWSAADDRSQLAVLVDEPYYVRPAVQFVDRLDEHHPDHAADGVALASRPPRLLKLANQSPDLWEFENLLDRPVRYLPTVHGTIPSVGQTPGCVNSAGVTLTVSDTDFTPRVGRKSVTFAGEIRWVAEFGQG